MASDRLKRLSSLADAYPVMNDELERREQSAIDYAVGSAIPTVQGRQGAQQLASQQAAATGQVQSQAIQRDVQTSTELGQQTAQEQARVGEENLLRTQMARDLANQQRASQSKLSQQANDIASRKAITESEVEMQNRMAQLNREYDTKLNVLTIEQRETIAQVGQDVKQKLFDDQMTFERDEIGRKFSNERQLADYAVANFKSNQQLEMVAREYEQAYQKDMVMLEAAHNVLVQSIEQGYKSSKQTLDQASTRKIKQQIRDLEREMARKQAKKSQNQAIITGVFTVAGAVVGGYATGGTGTAAGAAAGATVGAGIGQAVGAAST